MLLGPIYKLSHKLRSNPSRFLFNDFFFNFVGRDKDAETELMRKNWNAPPGSSIWDIGASLGKFTTLLAQANPQTRIYAFEPNLNSLYFLAHRTARFPNVTIVPCAVTADGREMKGSYNPDFGAPATGPNVPTLSIEEAVRKFGKPIFIKMDVEGEEFRIFSPEPQSLFGVHILVEWHGQLTGDEVPPFKHWTSRDFTLNHTYLEPVGDR
jgi:FkbM family methyltransferase